MDALATVLRLGGGHMIEDLHKALQRVSAEVVATGKKGAVTVTFDIDTPQAGEPMITVGTKVRVKMPESQGLGTVLFRDQDGFHQHDPRQAELPDFRVVEPRGEVIRKSGDEEESQEATSDG